jgi:hypothetical protein
MAADNKKKAQLIVGLTFLLGAITGGLIMHIIHSQQPGTSFVFTQELNNRVGLDEGQQRKLDEIIGESRKQHKQLREQMQPQFQSIRENTRAKIRAILSPEQQNKYNQWLQELDAKRAQREAKENNK